MTDIIFDARTESQKEGIPQVPEREVCAYIESQFERLGSRIEWYKQVRMLCWTHTLKDEPARLRIDYVVRIDGGLPLGIEAKASLNHPADLGRGLLQCVQYAFGLIASATPERIAPELVNLPLQAVFLWAETDLMPQTVVNHREMAHRLFGPANVGFAAMENRGLELRLCAEKFWNEWSGYHGGGIVTNKVYRSGNGTFSPTKSISAP